MKNLVLGVLIFQVYFLLCGVLPAQGHEDCPTCVRVRVALALAQAGSEPIAKPTPKSTPSVTAPAPVRIYRIGSLPPTWVPPAPMQSVVFPQYQAAPAICTPGG